MSIYKLQSSDNGSGDSVASIDIQINGFILAMSMNIESQGMDALSDRIHYEVSFLSANTRSVNDSRGSLMMHSLSQNFLTSGGGVGSSSHSISGVHIPVNAGERIHLHAFITSGPTGICNAFLYVDDGLDQKPAPRRR